MADPADNASRDAEVHTEAAIATVREKAKQPPSRLPCGLCHWCSERIADGLVFCDDECKLDFEKNARARQFNLKG